MVSIGRPIPVENSMYGSYALVQGI